MKNLRKCGWVVLILCATQYLFAQSKVQKLDRFIKKMYAQNQFNGGVLIAEKGKVIYKKTLGWRDAQARKKLDLQTGFQTASLSKTFTAVAIMILKEKKMLSYDDKLVKYLPELPYPNITIRHLITHTSGLYPYNPLFKKHWKDKNKIATNEDIIAMYKTHKPKTFFKPGTEWGYCNVGYVFLSSIVAKVAKMPFEDFLKQHIFVPAKMTQTQVYTKLNSQRIKNFAVEHVYDIGKQKQVSAGQIPGNEEIHYLHGKLGDDKVASTLEDLLKWDRVLYTNKIVSLQTLQEAFQPVASSFDKSKRHGKFDYGYGFQLDQHPKYGKVVYHNGGEPGLRVRFIRHIDQDKTIIIYGNMYSTYLNKIRDAVLQILYNQPYEIPKKLVSEALKPIILTKDSTYVRKAFQKLVAQKEAYFVREGGLEFLAGELWSRKKYREGLWLLHFMVEQFPKSANARYVLGEGYMETNQNQKAIFHFKKLLNMLKPRKTKRAESFRQYVQKLISRLSSK